MAGECRVCRDLKETRKRLAYELTGLSNELATKLAKLEEYSLTCRRDGFAASEIIQIDVTDGTIEHLRQKHDNSRCSIPFDEWVGKLIELDILQRYKIK